MGFRKIYTIGLFSTLSISTFPHCNSAEIEQTTENQMTCPQLDSPQLINAFIQSVNNAHWSQEGTRRIFNFQDKNWFITQETFNKIVHPKIYFRDSLFIPQWNQLKHLNIVIKKIEFVGFEKEDNKNRCLYKMIVAPAFQQSPGLFVQIQDKELTFHMTYLD